MSKPPLLAVLISVVSIVVIVGALVYGVTTAFAQYAPRDYQRDYQTGGNPLDDFFQRMDRNLPNPTLTCQTYKRLNRQGEIIWLRMECRS